MLDPWSPHAWVRARERYPSVPIEALQEVPGRIEAALRPTFDLLRPEKYDGVCFVSVIMPVQRGGTIKAKFIYSHVTRTIITALPFSGRYDKEYKRRFRVGGPTVYRPPLLFWGS